jgi:flagellar protein FlaG
VQELQAQNRELHFSRDEVTNRVVIEVRDLDGNVIRTIPPSKALDILSGADF